MSTRVVFLDRDGTLNEDGGYVHSARDWRFLPGVPQAIAQLRGAGFAVAMVSNQSGIGRGFYTAQDVEALHAFVQRALEQEGTRLDAIAYCPHVEADSCECRKPKTGLARQVEQQIGSPIDYRASWTIGDKPTDIQFGWALGTRTILLISRYWNSNESTPSQQQVAKSLLEATQILLG